MAMSADAVLDKAETRSGPSSVSSSRTIGLPLLMERVDSIAWDTIVATFDGAVQEQLAAFAAERWPNVDLDPCVFRLDGEIVGGCLVMLQPLPFGLGKVAVAKWGPIFKNNSRPDALVIYTAAVERMVEEYARERGLMLSILPRANPVSPNPQSAVLAAKGFRVGSGLPFPNRYVVNLRLADDEQRKSFAQKWRYHLNKSMKAELEFEHADPARIDEFDALYQVMADRKRFPDHSAYDTVPQLMAMVEAELRPELFFVRKNGEIIAGAIIFKAGDTAVYLYGATNEQALPLRAGYFLHWHIIRWLRDHTKAQWYDLGGTDGFQGLHQFKKGMVGDAGFIEPVPQMMSYAESLKAKIFGSVAFLARDVVAKTRERLERVRGGLARPDQDQR